VRVDSEEQRSLIVRLIDNMPMSGVLLEMNKTCMQLIDLRNAVQSAKIDVPSAKLAAVPVTELPKK
jgi:hypothetical protein